MPVLFSTPSCPTNYPPNDFSDEPAQSRLNPHLIHQPPRVWPRTGTFLQQPCHQQCELRVAVLVGQDAHRVPVLTRKDEEAGGELVPGPQMMPRESKMIGMMDGWR